MMTQSPHTTLTDTPPTLAPPQAAALVARLQAQVGQVVVGQAPVIHHALACLLAGGHLLLEDLPGVGKTTLAQALALSLGLQFTRVQFTADLMPTDLTGSSVFDRQREAFVFHPGPVFTQVLLADEINRAGPRTQSALLEAMEEHQVSHDGRTLPLPAPFFVIATQNPTEQRGTYPLPESQLDRFLMCLSLGYPDAAAERELLAGHDRRAALRHLGAALTPTELQALQAAVPRVHAAPALLDELQALIAATRAPAGSRADLGFAHGLSPRAGLAWLRAARAHALMDGRDHVLPDDLQAVAVPVLAHRLALRDEASASRAARVARVQALIAAVPRT